jgi:hypothetical protein
MRGTIRRWWRFTRTEAAHNQASTRLFNAVRSESSRTWCEWENIPWNQESAFSFNTLLV